MAEPDADVPTRAALVEALRTIETDAATLTEWARDVLTALEDNDDYEDDEDDEDDREQELIELAGYVDAILDYTKYVELVERWAEAQHS